jgi:hypothetical protein
MSVLTHTYPKCNQPLEHVRMFNEEVFGTKDNPYVDYVCRNEKCQGWFCHACEEWHPYGTCCAVAMVRNVRGGNYQDHDTSLCVEETKEKA